MHGGRLTSQRVHERRKKKMDKMYFTIILSLHITPIKRPTTATVLQRGLPIKWEGLVCLSVCLSRLCIDGVLQGGGETGVVLLQGVLRVEQDQVGEGSVVAGGGETILVLRLDHLQVLLAIIAAKVKSQRSWN